MSDTRKINAPSQDRTADTTNAGLSAPSLIPGNRAWYAASPRPNAAKRALGPAWNSQPLIPGQDF